MTFTVIERTDTSLPENGSSLILSDESANDQDKPLDFDADIGFGSYMIVDNVWIEYVAAATAGATKPIQITIEDSGGDTVGGTQLETEAADGAASLTVYSVASGFAASSRSITGGTFETDVLPGTFVLPRGCVLRVKAISGTNAADDMAVHVMGRVF